VQIAAWQPDGLRLTKIHRRLREQGVGVPYTSLHRFAQAHCGFGAPTVTVRVADPPPGEAAEADFGRLGLWPDPATGARRHVYGLLVTLAFSRYAFLWVALRQDLSTVLAGVEAAWAFFQGVVRRLVVDNLKPVITRADRYAPQIDPFRQSFPSDHASQSRPALGPQRPALTLPLLRRHAAPWSSAPRDPAAPDHDDARIRHDLLGDRLEALALTSTNHDQPGHGSS
jgi:transposase